MSNLLCFGLFRFWLVTCTHMYVTKYNCSVLDTEVLRQDDSEFVYWNILQPLVWKVTYYQNVSWYLVANTNHYRTIIAPISTWESSLPLTCPLNPCAITANNNTEMISASACHLNCSHLSSPVNKFYSIAVTAKAATLREVFKYFSSDMAPSQSAVKKTNHGVSALLTDPMDIMK
mgnify:CR=1 FL=1